MGRKTIPGCVLTLGKPPQVNFREPEVERDTHREARLRHQKKGGYYVSFWYDSYRHYAVNVKPGIPFVARRTKDYQYAGRHTGGAQQLRIDKVCKSTRNLHAKSLY